MRIDPSIHALWSGPEVEGRFKGLPTLIVTERATPAEVEAHAARFPHVFIEAGFAKLHGMEILHRLKAGKAVSLLIPIADLSRFPASECEGIHRVAFIDAPGLDDLTPTDSVALFVGPYRTMYGTVETLVQSKPADYDADELIR